ncbi:MAG: lipoyl(octanoyl) transferase LipB [Bacteroidota bacterium]|nr:lipoyl(octanoyl) transferase LipB [Bacteroidota bacterium]
MNDCKLLDLGLIDYQLVWNQQKMLFNQSIAQKLNNEKPANHLIVCEHAHVYTMGKSANVKNLLLNNLQLSEKKIDVYEIERGGDITYHGPGQLVVYPIFDLEQMGIGVKQFVFNIEQCLINTLAQIGIVSERIEGRIGIWLGKETPNERKIAAIGIKCSRHITMHGLAFNVNPDLTMFNFIIPCGIIDKSVTSIEKEFGRSIDALEIKKILLKEFSAIFDLKFI